MKISIIIPAYNEAENIGKLVAYLKKCPGNENFEILVADGQSSDETPDVAGKAGATAVLCPEKGRAAQMNYGAKKAKGTILYFLHADSYPPEDFYTKIIMALKSGNKSGCFRLRFDYDHWFLKLNCWFTRFNIDSFRFGDQSLFVEKDTFTRIGGFNEKLIVMEDNEIIRRIKKHSTFKVIDDSVKTSARKYLENGIYKLQFVFLFLYVLYKLGYAQETLLKTYKKLIRQDKM
ncbi:MAG: TIGR04283 family arsenosugar biosynthesis glycosyltransferase [Cytophagaceae bacterium]